MDILGLGSRHGLNNFEQIAILIVLVTAFISLIYAWLLKRSVLKKDKGDSKMQEVWEAIRIGAESYLSKQLKTILPAMGILFIALFLSVYVVPSTAEAIAEFPPEEGYNPLLIMAIGRAVAFILGAVFSLTVGQLGMRMAIQARCKICCCCKKRV